jgi:hypothetical protein
MQRIGSSGAVKNRKAAEAWGKPDSAACQVSIRRTLNLSGLHINARIVMTIRAFF